MTPERYAELGEVLARNIRAQAEARRRRDAERSLSLRMADRVTRFAGSMASVCVHLVLFGGWVVFNSGLIPGVTPIDPFPFILLAMVASVEAIFLSTFVLISQNRQATLDEDRAELDLQVGLLTEHELTKLTRAVRRIGCQLQVDVDELESIERDLEPTVLMEEIERGRS